MANSPSLPPPPPPPEPRDSLTTLRDPVDPLGAACKDAHQAAEETRKASSKISGTWSFPSFKRG